jgi:hypothetical protein
MANLGRLAIVVACVVVAAFAAVGAFVSMRLPSHPTAGERSEQQPPNPDALVRITPRRIPLAASVATLCIVPVTPNYGPHLAAEVHIYANQRVIDYRRDHPQEFDYPIGSKFIKEKFSHAGDENPDAATIMERTRSTGDVTDWAFSIVALPDKAPIKASGEVTCAQCHQEYKDTGYISTDSEAALKTHLGIR